MLSSASLFRTSFRAASYLDAIYRLTKRTSIATGVYNGDQLMVVSIVEHNYA